MARNIQPVVKRCRALGISPATLGYTSHSKQNSQKRFANVQRGKKKSEYAMQLAEKQKVKFIYGVLEKQFHGYFELANKKKGVTGENLLAILESRLDNVVFRLGWGITRADARQLVTHGFFTVNGKRVDIPSYLVSANDVIEVAEKYKTNARIENILNATEGRIVPAWLSADRDALKATVVEMPKREDVDFEVQEHLIVELYSK
ncbi:MAG: 30S ribosomal protein S4 [Clostridia bacterium]|nr:30S ribosomal protein S4 [Clostridia bacterium]